ncbi:MAG: hypothetical protein IJE78_13910 [Bacteroidaceae bacterium]|nr:hypothetical protein [Bacteroidaceae bacterium]
MNRRLDHILWRMMLIFFAASIHSCANEQEEPEYATVNFIATLSEDVHSRTLGSGNGIDSLWVGIFNKDTVEMARQRFAVSGSSIDIALTLPKNQTFHFVFWAYNSQSSAYNISSLKQIKMKQCLFTTWNEVEATDVFCANRTDITLQEGSTTVPGVELKRPLAQINVGTTGTPMPASFKVISAPDTFYPFSNSVSGTTGYSWNFSETTTETFTADGTKYNYLAMGYLFAPVATMKITAELELTGNDMNSQTIQFPQVEMTANRRSNIVGTFTQGNE